MDDNRYFVIWTMHFDIKNLIFDIRKKITYNKNLIFNIEKYF